MILTNQPIRLHTYIKPNLSVVVDKDFYSKQRATEIFNALEEQIDYGEQQQIKMMGKLIDIPRKQVAYGDPGTSYSFSGIKVDAKPWIPLLLEIKRRVEIVSGETFNFCLVNRYKDGTDYIGYHADDEDDLSPTAPIGSVSFGASRKFYFKSISNPDDKITDIVLNNGTLCLIEYPTNDHYKHSVPKELKVKNPRINLTFRSIIVK